MANAAITVDLNARIAQFESELKRATGTLDTFGKKGNAALAGLRGLGAGLAGALSVGAITAFAKSGIDAADSLNDLSLRTQVAVNDLASFKLAAEQNGTSLDAVGEAIRKLNLSVSQGTQGSKQQAEALQRLGVTSADARERVFQIADAYASAGDKTRVLADLQALLGESYATMLPLLSQGGTALRQSADASESFASAMARLAPDADKFNDQMAELKINASGAAAGLLNDLVPALNRVFERFERLGRLRDAGASLSEIITGNVSANTKTSLDAKQKEISDVEKRIATIKRNPRAFPDNGESLKQAEAELSRLKAIRAELQLIAVEKIQGIKPRAATPPAGENTAQIQCVLNGGIWDGQRCVKKNTTGTKADPLAGLFASTDVGKLRAFQEQVALLNQRLNYGAKDTELYTQAMTDLVEKTFANNFKQAADDAEFFRMVEEDGIQTTREWKQHLDDLANVDMGRLNDLLADTDFARLKSDQEDMILLTKAFSEGIKDADGNLRQLSEAEYLDAVANRLGLATDKVRELDTFAKTAAENIQDSFADFLFDPFDEGMDGMLKGFGKTLQRMAADAAAADIARFLFGDNVKGGSGSGVAGAFLSSIGSFFGFADGGIMTDRGPLPLRAYAGGGVASSPQLAVFGEGRMNEAFVPLPDGRSIPVSLKGGGGGGGGVVLQQTIHIDARGADSGVEARIRQAAAEGARQGYAMVVDDLSRGGAVARLVGRA